MAAVGAAAATAGGSALVGRGAAAAEGGAAADAEGGAAGAAAAALALALAACTVCSKVRAAPSALHSALTVSHVDFRLPFDSPTFVGKFSIAR